MAARKKYPEFELPPVILDAVKGYIGTTKMATLTANQRSKLAALAAKMAEGVGIIIDHPAAAMTGMPSDD